MQRNLSRIFKTEYYGETNGPNSREGHFPQEMVKSTPIAVKTSYSSLKNKATFSLYGQWSYDYNLSFQITITYNHYNK